MKPSPEASTTAEEDTQFTSEPELNDLHGLSDFLEEQLTGTILTTTTGSTTLKEKLQLQLGKNYAAYRNLVLHYAAWRVVLEYRSDTSNRVKRIKKALKEEQFQAEKQGLSKNSITSAENTAHRIARSFYEIQISKGEITGGTDPHAFLAGTDHKE